MAHLDTAYKLGALQAQTDFDQEIQKLALEGTAPPQNPTTIIPGQSAAPVKRPVPMPPAAGLPGRGVGGVVR